jgi:regulation of enolase protein 1 (concanavalin A-like superfamily)
MNLRAFVRFHLFKTLIVLVVIQVIIILIVQNFNHRPLAVRDVASVTEGKRIKMTPIVNDSDKDTEDKLSIGQLSKPFHGKAEQAGNVVYYTPDDGYIGPDSLTYTASDGRKASKSAVIRIQVNKNMEPMANRDIAQAYCGGSALVDVLGNDTDPEFDSLFIKEFSQPLHGRLTLEGNRFIYTTACSRAVPDSFSYTVSDGMNKSNRAFVVIDVKPNSDPCYPWLSCDVGDAAIPGSSTSANGKFIMTASGSDIWNNADGFRYAYQYVDGDCEMYTRIESLEGTHEWTKAGIMIRESLRGNARTAYVCVTTRNGATYHRRSGTSYAMEGGNSNQEIKAPYWVKLTRKGDSLSFDLSPDGRNWSNLGAFDVSMPDRLYIGFAVTSHDNGSIAKAVFTNYHLTGAHR